VASNRSVIICGLPTMSSGELSYSDQMWITNDVEWRVIVLWSDVDYQRCRVESYRSVIICGLLTLSSGELSYCDHLWVTNDAEWRDIVAWSVMSYRRCRSVNVKANL